MKYIHIYVNIDANTLFYFIFETLHPLFVKILFKHTTLSNIKY